MWILIPLFGVTRALLGAAGEAHKAQIDSERARHAGLPAWSPQTREEADDADEDEDWLAKAEKYEKSRQLTKALKIYRALAKCSPVPEIVVEAKIGIKRVKRAQGL